MVMLTGGCSLKKRFASKILFTTADGQVTCNCVYLDNGKLVNLPIGEHALRQTLDEQFERPVFSPHHEINAEFVPNENPLDYLKSMPYLYNGSYYRATHPEWIDVDSLADNAR